MNKTTKKISFRKHNRYRSVLGTHLYGLRPLLDRFDADLRKEITSSVVVSRKDKFGIFIMPYIAMRPLALDSDQCYELGRLSDPFGFQQPRKIYGPGSSFLDPFFDETPLPGS